MTLLCCYRLWFALFIFLVKRQNIQLNKGPLWNKDKDMRHRDSRLTLFSRSCISCCIICIWLEVFHISLLHTEWIRRTKKWRTDVLPLWIAYDKSIAQDLFLACAIYLASCPLLLLHTWTCFPSLITRLLQFILNARYVTIHLKVEDYLRPCCRWPISSLTNKISGSATCYMVQKCIRYLWYRHQGTNQLFSVRIKIWCFFT